MTTLAAAEVDGERLTDAEILVFFALLVFAGNDTTRNTMAGGMRALLDPPRAARAAARASRERIEDAVEEILRWTSRRQLLLPHRDHRHRARRRGRSRRARR